MLTCLLGVMLRAKVSGSALILTKKPGPPNCSHKKFYHWTTFAPTRRPSLSGKRGTLKNVPLVYEEVMNDLCGAGSGKILKPHLCGLLRTYCPTFPAHVPLRATITSSMLFAFCRNIKKNCALRFSNRGRTSKNRSPLAG